MKMITWPSRRRSYRAGLTALVAVAAGTALAPAASATASVHPAATTNLVKNGSFEKAIRPGATQCNSTSVSTGNWQPYSQTAGYAPTRVTSPVHSGTHALNVSGPALATSCTAYGAYQDIASGALPADTSFKFSVWVYPVTGTQSQTVLYPWVNRGHGGFSPFFNVSEDLSNGTVEVDAWGTSTTVTDALTTSTWHHVTLNVNASTFQATLSIDGTKVATTPAGSSFSAAAATVWIGQPQGLGAAASDFDYDQVSLTLG